MTYIKSILKLILFIAGILLGFALLACLIVLAAYGLGLLLNQLLHFQTFEAVLLSLLAIGILMIIVVQMLASPIPLNRTSSEDDFDEDEEWEWDDDEDEDEDEEENDDDIPQPIVLPGIPRWRQPLKTVDFSNTKPDARCPCGSGRKYKNCHGAKNAAN
jgi:hypothetical protein